MDHDHHLHRLLLSTTLLSLLYLSIITEVEPASFKIVNRCRRAVWPGLLSGAGTAQLPTTGFALQSGKSRTITIPKSWSGRIWGRTLCTQFVSNRSFSCVTGDCGSGKLECAGGGAEPPATLAEFTLNGADGLDFYDVSLVDGYNLPMLVLPRGGKGGGCAATGCLVDLNGACPAELRVAGGRNTRGVACKSACEAFGDPRYCCSEAYATPDTCAPSVYSLFFKHACPRAYSYAYDDKTSTYTCASADYVIMFCPPPYSSQKVLGARKDVAVLPLVNKTTMYISRRLSSGALSLGSPQWHITTFAAYSIDTFALFIAYITIITNIGLDLYLHSRQIATQVVAKQESLIFNSCCTRQVTGLSIANVVFTKHILFGSWRRGLLQSGVVEPPRNPLENPVNACVAVLVYFFQIY